MSEASAPNLHVFTGATGFVGSATVLELLERDPSARVVAIVRPGEEGAPARLRAALREAARLYDLGAALDAAIEARCDAVPGDVTLPLCGAGEATVAALQGAEFWHSAASLQYLDRHADNINRINVDGTANALALARALRARRVNVVSTAYVAGRRVGEIAEAPVEAGANNNHYERSKVASESMALAASDLFVRVLRPSVVIGHSRTRAALNFNGLYGFVRALVKFRGAMERAQRGIAERLETQIRADAATTLNFIPVDYVARDAVRLSLADAAPGIYHLTAAESPSVRCLMDVAFGVVGLRPPTLVDTTESMTWIDRKLDERVDFYATYFRGTKVFARARTDGAVGSDDGGSFVVDRDELRAFCDWYHERLVEERKSLPETE